MGERTELSPQANSTACGRPPATASPLPMQYGEEGEQPPCGVEIHRHLVLQPFPQQLGTLVVERSPPHVDRLDVARRRGADRLVIALADHEIVLDQAPERRQRQVVRDYRVAALGANVQYQAVFHHLEPQAV